MNTATMACRQIQSFPFHAVQTLATFTSASRDSHTNVLARTGQTHKHTYGKGGGKDKERDVGLNKRIQRERERTGVVGVSNK